MNKALLDTDILSEIGKGIDRIVAQNAAYYRQQHRVLTFSVISVMEIVQGYQRVGSTARIHAFRKALLTEEVLLLDQSAADLAGQIAGDLDKIGKPIGRCDPMIAAIAITQGLELVTGNLSHYHRLLPLGYPVTLVNWRDAA